MRDVGSRISRTGRRTRILRGVFASSGKLQPMLWEREEGVRLKIELCLPEMPSSRVVSALLSPRLVVDGPNNTSDAVDCLGEVIRASGQPSAGQ